MRDDDDAVIPDVVEQPAEKEAKPKRVRKKKEKVVAVEAATEEAAPPKLNGAARKKKSAASPNNKRKAKAKTKAPAPAPAKPSAKKEAPAGLLGEVCGVRVNTAVGLALAYLIDNEKKQISFEKLERVAYPGKKVVPPNALKTRLKVIEGAIKSKKLKWELRYEKKESTVGLYPVR